MHHLARSGGRYPDSIAVAIIALARRLDHVAAAATLFGALQGPVMGPIPLTWSAKHQARIDAARERVATDLDPDAYTAAQQRGAAMSYDEIIAYTLEQLAQIAAQ